MRHEHVELICKHLDCKYTPHLTDKGGFFRDQVGYCWDSEDFEKLIAAIEAPLIKTHNAHVTAMEKRNTELTNNATNSAARLRVICNKLGVELAIPEEDEELGEVMFSVLGMVRQKLEEMQRDNERLTEIAEQYQKQSENMIRFADRIAELERENAELKAKQKLSERVTDYNFDHLYFKVADEVITQAVFNEIVREWLKELEQ